ncbi:MAG: phosphoribosylglycinamide formyltransferase [Flavobacteriaceae bacterium]
MGTKTFKRIILFASGSGSNVENIIQYFKHNSKLEIVKVFTNNPKAGVIDRISPMNIPISIFDKVQLANGQLRDQIKLLNPDLIVLAGFLLKIPLDFVKAFPDKIINIHPSLLPKHGGKGMYGDFVHRSVKDSGDKQTGITIHFVNEQYDQGTVIFQAKVSVDQKDSIRDIAEKVHQLEYKHYPQIIENLLLY